MKKDVGVLIRVTKDQRQKLDKMYRSWMVNQSKNYTVTDFIRITLGIQDYE